MGQTATGTCGAASVRVSGVDGEWISPTGQVEIKGKTGSLRIGVEPYLFLEDRNVVACVASKAGPRILLLAYWTSLARSVLPSLSKCLASTRSRYVSIRR